MMHSEDMDTPSGVRSLPVAFLFLFLAAALGSLLALAAAAQEPAPAPTPSSGTEDETFFESIDVNVVNVEVVVTDRSGKRVTGLTRDDFELREDGKPVELTNFFAVAGQAEAAAETLGAAPTPEAPASAPAVLPDDQQLFLAVFIDNRSMMPATRGRVLKSLQEALRSRLDAQDRVLLVTYDGSVKVHRLPDARPETVAAVLDEIAKSPARGAEVLVDRNRLLQEIAQGGTPPGPGETPRADSSDLQAAKIYAGIKLYAQARHGENERALHSLGQVVDSLAGLPGRKALLFVTGGLSLRPGEAVYRAWANKYERMRFEVGASELDIAQFDATPLLNRLAERANTNRVTFYALGSAEGVSGLSADSQGGNFWSRELERTESMNYSQSLQTLAGATGGLSAFDPVSANSFLARMTDDLGSYYSLGYTPQRRPDGKKHKLKVAVKRDGLTARYREAHRDRGAEERMASQTLSALLFGETDNPLEAALEFESERPGGKKGEIEVSILVKVPMAKLVLLPQEHVHEGRLRVFVGARDALGRVSDVTTVEAPIRIPNENLLTALGQVVACRVTLVLRAGEHVIAASIWDDLGKSDSTVVAHYNAGAPAAAVAPAAATGAP
ncbi:MAG TPA: VWA domain-containing protein [Thermoanaerobaculia bacterium]|nr:VWA domain-containing protein [Thermoanaerobaculia bacterium]